MWMRFNMCDSEEMTMLRVLLSSLSGQAPPSSQPGQHNGRNRTSWLQKNKPSVSQKPLEPWLQRASNSCSCSWTVAGKWPKEGLFRAMAGERKVVRHLAKRQSRLLRGVSCDLSPRCLNPSSYFSFSDLAIEIFVRVF